MYIRMVWLIAAAVGWAFTSAREVRADDAAPKFAVIVPERIDHDWYWLLYSDQSQHIVQGRIEKALIRAGAEVIDISAATMPAFDGNWSRLLSKEFALEVGRELGVDYIISGQATAVKASEGKAYGVNVVRAQAEVTAKLIRVNDGRIIEIFDHSVLEGGQSAQAAGQEGLKKAGGVVGGKIGRAVITMRKAAEAGPAQEPEPAP